jgi:hypothetical protein
MPPATAYENPLVPGKGKIAMPDIPSRDITPQEACHSVFVSPISSRKADLIK